MNTWAGPSPHDWAQVAAGPLTSLILASQWQEWPNQNQLIPSTQNSSTKEPTYTHTRPTTPHTPGRLVQSGSPRWHLLRPAGNTPKTAHPPDVGRPFPTERGSLLGPQVFNQQGGPAFHGWKDLFALQDPWEVSGPISKPEAQAREAAVWETDPIPQGWGPERGLGDSSYRHWEEERCEQTQVFHGYPTGVGGGCSLGQGEWAWAWLRERSPHRGKSAWWGRREHILWGRAGLLGQQHKGSLGPRVFLGASNVARKPRGPHRPLRVCLCVCVGQGRALPTLIGHARRLVGAWGGGSSLPPAHQPGFSSSTSTAAPASNQWSQITFRRAGPGLG